MKTIKISGKEYTLEFSFEAAECKNVVQEMFNIMSGSYFIRNGLQKKNAAAAMIDGTVEMVADMPAIARNAFYAGLLEHNPVSEDEAKTLMKQYMRENSLSFAKLYEELKQCMEEDGFFDLSGIMDMIQEMNNSIEDAVKDVKKPKENKGKSTSMK